MRMKTVLLTLVTLISLAGCAMQPGPGRSINDLLDARDVRLGRQDFVQVINDIEPEARRACRAAQANIRCDFRIVVDDDPNVPPLAFITLAENGQPVIVFSIALIDGMQNSDEMAFVMSHEVAHHIADHFRRDRENARLGAEAFAQLAGSAGAVTPEQIEASQQLGALVGSRIYSREFELEADILGARIAAAAGYDPVRGAGYFTRIPDPGDRFLGTHPPNAQRIEAVNQVARDLGLL